MKLYEILDTKIDIELISNKTNTHFITYQATINNLIYKCDFEKMNDVQIKQTLGFFFDVIFTSDFDLKYDDDELSNENIKQLQRLKTNINKYKNLWMISFSIETDGESDYSLTNNYDAIQVFNFIKLAYEDFKQKHKIDSFCYESKTTKRSKLYKRLFNKFLIVKNAIEFNHNNDTFAIMEI